MRIRDWAMAIIWYSWELVLFLSVSAGLFFFKFHAAYPELIMVASVLNLVAGIVVFVWLLVRMYTVFSGMVLDRAKPVFRNIMLNILATSCVVVVYDFYLAYQWLTK